MNESEIIDEINSHIKARKVIIPFAKQSISCNAVLNSNNIAYLDLSNYQAIEEYCSSDKIITVQCGIKVKNLQDFLAREKQWLPLAYSNDETSLLDLILTDDNGPLEALFGGLRRHILGMSFALSNGQIAKTGGKVVKNVSGYDLTRFLIGSYGYFAIPIKAHLRMYSLPEEFLSIKVESNDFGQLLSTLIEISRDGVGVTYADIIDKKLLKKEFFSASSNHSKRFILILQLYGDQNAVLAGVSKVKNVLADKKLEYLDVPDIDQQNRILQDITSIGKRIKRNAQIEEPANSFIDLVLNNKECLAFSQEVELFSFPFLYRSTSQRLRITANSSTQLDTLLNLLTEYAKRQPAPITVAYSNDKYIRLVDQLGQEINNNKAMSEVEQRLKHAFDPANLFNPFVEF